jgi:hypothetical protein
VCFEINQPNKTSLDVSGRGKYLRGKNMRTTFQLIVRKIITFSSMIVLSLGSLAIVSTSSSAATTPEVCPVFVSGPTVSDVAPQALAITWQASDAGSWAARTSDPGLYQSGVGLGSISIRTGLTPDTTYFQYVTLWSGADMTGCRVSKLISGKTAAVPVPPTPTPSVTPAPTPSVTPTPQVSPVPVGPVKTGDGSLG